MQYATEPKCNYCDACMSEHCGCKLGRIKEMEPTCDSTAVIPSITVESVEGITNLANCLVHVEDINTTFYVDDKHRVMITWAGPVDIPGYDMENNPEGFRNQIVTDTEAGLAVIYDAKGVGYTFGIEQGLDVTEAVNNKINKMAEDGTLAEIIERYLKDKVIYDFDTVADMKLATDLVDGSYAKTYGFYSLNDGGGAEYVIKAVDEADVIDDATIISISGQLNAHLIVKREMSVKQFGCRGNGSTDDTTRFGIAIANSKKLIVDEGTYLVGRLLPEANQEIVGEGQAIIKLTGTIAPLVNIKSNSTLSNLDIRSTNPDLPNNRCDINNKEYVTLENCKISGFRHNSISPNAWGVLITNSTNITINNCYFDNNSQSDIAITNGNTNIRVTNTLGSNLSINIEPENISANNKNILIENCNIGVLKAQENDYLGTATTSLVVLDCVINDLRYDGSTATIINCKILDINPQILGSVQYAGSLKLINSGNFSGNMLDDPYLDLYQNTTDSSQPWLLNSSSQSLQNTVSSTTDVNGIQFVLNPTNLSAGMSIKSQPITISDTKKYLLRIIGKVNYPEGSLNKSLNYKISWLQGATELRRDVISAFRSNNSSSDFGEQLAVLAPPEYATNVVIYIYASATTTGGATGTQSVYIRSLELFQFNNSEHPNNLIDLEVRKNRIFKKATVVGGTFNKFEVGDMLLYTTPSSYIGQVCTVAGYGNSATWKNFGALEA